MHKFRNAVNRFSVGAAAGGALLVTTVGKALAADPTTMAEVATQTIAGIKDNTFLYGIMGASMLIAVAIMLYRRGKTVAK